MYFWTQYIYCCIVQAMMRSVCCRCILNGGVFTGSTRNQLTPESIARTHGCWNRVYCPWSSRLYTWWILWSFQAFTLHYFVCTQFRLDRPGILGLFLKFKSESKQNRTHQHGIDRRAKISLTMTKMTPWQLPIYIPPPPPIRLPVDLRPNDRKLRSCVFCPSSSVACTFYSTRIVEPDSAECKLCGSIRPNLPHGV